MSMVEKQEQKKQACFSDYVVDVPKIIINQKQCTAYQRLQFLGSGSYSKCYEVLRTVAARHYACKVLSKVMVQDIHLKRLVQNEIKIHCQLRHKHVVEFMESFQDEKHIYMIQSLCLNHSLRELVKHRGVVSEHECRYFLNQVLQGVDYIHKIGIIHRDLKLGNILIDGNMQMKIGDFGLAIECNSPRLKTKSLCGTTNYLAPEVVDRKGFALGSDIWACGIIAFILLYGYSPFEEHDAMETYKRISRGDFFLPTELNEDAKHFFKSLLEKDLSRRPSAEKCLKLPFFVNHDIPSELSDKIFYQSHVLDQLVPDEPTSNLNVDSVMITKNVQIEYPELRFFAQPQLVESTENAKFGHILYRIYERFDDICRFNEPKEDYSFGDITDFVDAKPNYWIGKWFLEYVDGFVYQLSDKSVGMLFNDGLKFIQTPGKEYLMSEPGQNRFHAIRESHLKPDVNDALKTFRELKKELKVNGYFEAETPFNRSKLPPYLYTWFQTNEAMIMLLSNQTVQVNFVKSHKKMLICPKIETVTLADGKITRANFKTVSLTALAMHRCSTQNLDMLKYVTASLKFLSSKLSD